MKTFLLLVLTSWAAAGTSIPGSRDAWLKLLAMPTTSVSFSAGMTTSDGLVLSNDRPNPEVEIPRLRAQLKGTPADATLYWEMSRIYSRVEDDANRSNTLARVVALYRQRLETQPENVEALTGLGLALSAQSHLEEADVVLRRAAGIDPKDWRVWAARAQWHDRKAWAAFEALATTNHQNFVEYLLNQAARRAIPADVLEAASTSAQEAAQCADRAIELAPQEAQAYSTRAQTRAIGNQVTFLRAVATGEEEHPEKFAYSLFGTNVLADLWRLAELSPADPRAQSMALMGQFTVAAFTLGNNDPATPLIRLLPDPERRLCLAALDRLQEISQTRPPDEAALALETTAIMKWQFLRDIPGAEAGARRAIELAPARETGWDLMMAICAVTGRPEVALPLAEKRLQVKDTARNRIIAAKVCDKLGRMPEAKVQVDAALKLEPNGYLPNLAAFVLALKRSTDLESTARALPFLENLQKPLAGDVLTMEQRIEIILATGIGAVLSDETAEARQLFESVLRMDKSNQTARQALAMLAGKQ